MYHKESYKKNNSEKYHRKTQEIFDKVVENLKNIVNNARNCKRKFLPIFRKQRRFVRIHHTKLHIVFFLTSEDI